MVVVFYVQICCSVEGLFSCRRILPQRGTFSQYGQGRLFLPGDFQNLWQFPQKWFEHERNRPQTHERFSFNEAFLHAWWLPRVRERLLYFGSWAPGWFTCLHVQEWFLVESNPFVHFCAQESYLCFLHLSREFDSICLFHNFSSFFCLGSIGKTHRQCIFSKTAVQLAWVPRDFLCAVSGLVKPFKLTRVKSFSSRGCASSDFRPKICWPAALPKHPAAPEKNPPLLFWPLRFQQKQRPSLFPWLFHGSVGSCHRKIGMCFRYIR